MPGVVSPDTICSSLLPSGSITLPCGRQSGTPGCTGSGDPSLQCSRPWSSRVTLSTGWFQGMPPLLTARSVFSTWAPSVSAIWLAAVGSALRKPSGCVATACRKSDEVWPAVNSWPARSYCSQLWKPGGGAIGLAGPGVWTGALKSAALNVSGAAAAGAPPKSAAVKVCGWLKSSAVKVSGISLAELLVYRVDDLLAAPGRVLLRQLRGGGGFGGSRVSRGTAGWRRGAALAFGNQLAARLAHSRQLRGHLRGILAERVAEQRFLLFVVTLEQVGVRQRRFGLDELRVALAVGHRVAQRLPVGIVRIAGRIVRWRQHVPALVPDDAGVGSGRNPEHAGHAGNFLAGVAWLKKLFLAGIQRRKLVER